MLSVTSSNLFFGAIDKKAEAKITLEAYYKNFERSYLKTACSESTAKRYEECFRLYTLPKFGKLGLEEIAREQIKETGPRHAVRAVFFAAFLIGLPIFFEVGFIILVPLVYRLMREWGKSLLYFGMSVAAPPPREVESAPHPMLVALVLLLPVILFFAASFAEMTPAAGSAAYQFLGRPFTALMSASTAAMVFFGVRRGLNRDGVLKLAEEALKPLGSLPAIIGGGGAFKQIIVNSGAGA